MNNYYDILGVNKDSTTEEIKKAYRKLSKEHHPDRGGDSEKFKEISEAYNTLGDANKRNAYDQRQNNPFSGEFSHDAMGDMFRDMFGGQNRGNAGEDLVLNIQVSLEEIHTGTTKKVRYKRRVPNNKVPPRMCSTCNGTGSVTLMGPFKSRCGSCNGSGRIVNTIILEQELSFDIPKGVKDGERIFYGGFGNYLGGRTGHLYVTIKIAQHDIFTREGDNLVMRLYISFPDIILGKSIEVKTLTGKIKINIGEGSKPFQRMRVAGKGLHREGGMGVGDLIVELVPVTPLSINDKERKLLEELKVSENFNNLKY